jgi:hypothetical protein
VNESRPIFRQTRMFYTECHCQGRRRFQPDMNAHHASGRHVDCERKPRATDWPAICGVDNDCTRERVIYLDEFERIAGLQLTSGNPDGGSRYSFEPNRRRATWHASLARMRLMTLPRAGVGIDASSHRSATNR